MYACTLQIIVHHALLIQAPHFASMVPYELHLEPHTYVLEHVPWHTAATSHLTCAWCSEDVRIHIMRGQLQSAL